MSTNQYNNLTTSNNGRNVMPLLQAKSHFFLQDAKFTQSTPFGAISANQFNTTSTVKTTGAKKVYAICKGTVLLQPQTSNANTKVNLILKPFNQPIKNIGIKYIIYRGLNKADFISGKNIKAAIGEDTTHFINYIQAEFEAFHKKEDEEENGEDNNTNETPPAFLAKYIGYPEKVSDQKANQLIDHLFYKITTTETNGDENQETAYELPTIPRGTQLGTVNGDIGIDIILNKGDYYTESDADLFQLDLTYARAATGSIKLSGNNFFKKRQREMATQFMDVAAFYGLHANGAGKLYQTANATALTKAADIDKLLNGFSSKNTTYIYIQANRQRSYNFYGNYAATSDNANNIKIGKPGEAPTETTFGTNGWPIHQYEPTITADKPAAFALQLITDNYPGAALYVHTGTLLSQQEENFVRNENLLQTTGESPAIYTQPLHFALQNNSNKAIAGFINLLYKGKQQLITEYLPPENTEQPTQTLILKDIDDVFGLLDATLVNTPENELQLPTIVDERLQVINFSNISGDNNIGIIKHKKIEDYLQTIDEDTKIGRVTYETLQHSIKQTISSTIKGGSHYVDSSNTGLNTYSKELNNFYLPKLPYFFDKEMFTSENFTITGLNLSTQSGELPLKKILGIAKEEFKQLKNLAISNDLINAKIYFRENIWGESLSSENVNYKTYFLEIIGEGENGKLFHFKTVEPVKVYSINGFIFFSKAYSDYIPELVIDSFDLLKIDLIPDN